MILRPITMRKKIVSLEEVAVFYAHMRAVGFPDLVKIWARSGARRKIHGLGMENRRWHVHVNNFWRNDGIVRAADRLG